MESSTIKVLADHDIEGYATLLWGTLSSSGWLELIPMKLIGFEDVHLSIKSTDREVWRFTQANGMILLTNNRSMKDKDSLEQTIREENKSDSLPILTFSNRDRLANVGYREQCADRLVEIISELENYLGIGRVFIP